MTRRTGIAGSFAAVTVAGTGRAVAADDSAGGAPAFDLPHTVGMSGPDVDRIEAGIAAYRRGDFRRAYADFAAALAVRSETAVANFNLGVTELRLGERERGVASMRRGFRLAGEHGMADSSQARRMLAIARAANVDLR